MVTSSKSNSFKPWNPAGPPIEPDSLQGLIFALEGTEGLTVLLNGPTGCKYYHGAISEGQTVRDRDFDPLSLPMNWYFGQARVPCTYLDNGDYVYGSERKLIEALEYFRDAPETGMLCIVNSPGASLIGDDLRSIAQRTLGDRPFVTVETPGFSLDWCQGHELGARVLVEQLALSGGKTRPRSQTPEQERGQEQGHVPARAAEQVQANVSARSQAPELPNPKPRANILGLSLFHRYHTGDVEAVRQLVESCGLSVGCVLCAGGSIQEVGEIGKADLNVVVHPELGLAPARFLEERFGTPYYVCDGPPVGFDAAEQVGRDLAKVAGGDASALLRESRKARRRAFSSISHLNSITGLPKGVTYAVEGTYSQLYSYVKFLTEYFAMVPVALVPSCPQSDVWRGQLEGLLETYGCQDALSNDPVAAAPELAFGSATLITRLRLANIEFSGVETMLPTLGYIDVVPKTHLGTQGALLLVESVLNGLLF